MLKRMSHTLCLALAIGIPVAAYGLGPGAREDRRSSAAPFELGQEDALRVVRNLVSAWGGVRLRGLQPDMPMSASVWLWQGGEAQRLNKASLGASNGDVVVTLQDVDAVSSTHMYRMAVSYPDGTRAVLHLPKAARRGMIGTELGLVGSVDLGAAEEVAIWGYGEYERETPAPAQSIRERAKAALWAVVIALEPGGAGPMER